MAPYKFRGEPRTIQLLLDPQIRNSQAHDDKDVTFAVGIGGIGRRALFLGAEVVVFVLILLLTTFGCASHPCL